eukprot:223127_1
MSQTQVHNNPTDDIQIHVKICNGKTITIAVQQNATIKDVKNAIYKQENVQIEIQTLFFQDSVLDDNQTLTNYGIETQSPPIDLAKADNELMQFLKKNNLFQYNIYHILIKQNISYAELQCLTPKNIDDICSKNNIDVGTTIKIQQAIENHQKQIMRDLEKEHKFDNEMSVILIGDSEVGKTCLIHKFITGKYNAKMLRTFGVGDKKIRYLTLQNESIMKITIWDTSGQERFHSLTSSYYKKGDVILYCYDISNSNSLDNCEWWFDRIKQHAKDNVLIEIIGCKSDAITNIELKPNVFDKILNCKQWQEYNIEHVECSSQTGENVENVFITAAEMMCGSTQENINNLYAAIQNTMMQHGIDLDTMKNDIKSEDVETFCTELKFSTIQKVKFRKLMRLIHDTDVSEEEKHNNNKRPSVLSETTECIKCHKSNFAQCERCSGLYCTECDPLILKKDEHYCKRCDGCGCFSFDSFVITYPNYEEKTINELEIYDKILTYDPSKDKYFWDDLLIKCYCEK